MIGVLRNMCKILHCRLSKIIDQEVRKVTYGTSKLGISQRRVSAVRTFKAIPKSNMPAHTDESLHLDVLDLARIAQEIKEKETEKKLNKFLNTPV